jgi:hypothetical protein
MISELTRRECEVILRSDLSYFAERCFYQLNPQAPFFPNWHIEVIAAKLAAVREGTQLGRVGMWRGDVRSGMRVAASFVWRCPSGSTIAPFPHPAHRTGHADFPASGSRTRRHAFAHGRSCPSRVRRTSPKVS